MNTFSVLNHRNESAKTPLHVYSGHCSLVHVRPQAIFTCTCTQCSCSKQAIQCTCRYMYSGASRSNCPDRKGVLNSGIVLYRTATIGTKASVHIREVSLFQKCPYFRGVHSERFHCTCIYYACVFVIKCFCLLDCQTTTFTFVHAH